MDARKYFSTSKYFRPDGHQCGLRTCIGCAFIIVRFVAPENQLVSWLLIGLGTLLSLTCKWDSFGNVQRADDPATIPDRPSRNEFVTWSNESHDCNCCWRNEVRTKSAFVLQEAGFPRKNSYLSASHWTPPQALVLRAPAAAFFGDFVTYLKPVLFQAPHGSY